MLFSILCCFLTMSLVTYQIIGATRCKKIKKHPGIKLKPLYKAKDLFQPGDMLIYTCESNESTQSIRCLDDGNWSTTDPCPDPSNFTCPDLTPTPHGSYNVSGPSKVGTIVSFKCDNETFSNSTTTITTSSSTSSSSSSNTIRYEPTHKILKCLPSSKWNHPAPVCTPIVPEPATSNMGLYLTSAFLILIPILIIVFIVNLFIRWKKKQQQRERWKQYFTDYRYRHSKTSITFRRPQDSAATIPVTDL